MNETREAIYEALTGDATLTALLATPTSVFHQIAPQTASTPYVVFHRQDGRPVWQFASASVQRDVWTIKAIDKSSSASKAEDIAKRIDLVLTDTALQIDDATCLAIYREADIDYPETVGADTYRHAGGLFRVVTQPA